MIPAEKKLSSNPNWLFLPLSFTLTNANSLPNCLSLTVSSSIFLSHFFFLTVSSSCSLLPSFCLTVSSSLLSASSHLPRCIYLTLLCFIPHSSSLSLPHSPLLNLTFLTLSSSISFNCIIFTLFLIPSTSLFLLFLYFSSCLSFLCSKFVILSTDFSFLRNL